MNDTTQDSATPNETKRKRVKKVKTEAERLEYNAYMRKYMKDRRLRLKEASMRVPAEDDPPASGNPFI